jgi:hypothetical protein
LTSLIMRRLGLCLTKEEKIKLFVSPVPPTHCDCVNPLTALDR